MKIIQTFSQFDEGSPYLNRTDINKYKVYLNFYSFLLSCISIQKYYDVVMYCNQKAYDSFIKYIPYGEIKIVENKNSFRFWNMSKFDAMKTIDEKFIHTDSDVFIFKDCFSGFTKTDKYDVIIQDTIPPHKNFVKHFVPHNEKILKELDIIDSEIYDDRCVSCGTMGMTPSIRDQYIELVEKLKHAYENNLLIGADIAPTMIIEELGLHLLILKNKLRKLEVLPYEEVLKYDVHTVGDIQKYTHMWINTKFEIKYIDLIRNKIFTDFPEYSNLIQKYESEVIKKISIYIK